MRTHTAGLDTIFVQIYMDALPGVPGVSKKAKSFTEFEFGGLAHPVQKLRDNLDKYPRTFDSCFLSYMIDTYIKTLKK